MNTLSKTLVRASWSAQIAAHRARLSPIVERHLFLRSRGIKHPVYDFLFDYYTFSSGQLLRWSPGINVGLEQAAQDEVEWGDFYRSSGELLFLDVARFPARRIPFLKWVSRYLEETLKRTPTFSCFGVHEWAMLYKTEDKRHAAVKLRVSSSELEGVVEASPIRCSHFDAFRFFTNSARPLNRLELTRENVAEHDQPGCIHANMDLYRWGYKIAPFVPADLLAELFLLAREAREIDMRASPYDLTAYDLVPIQIETKEGREEYVLEQRRLYEKAHPYRARLLGVYSELLNAVIESNLGREEENSSQRAHDEETPKELTRKDTTGDELFV